MKEPKSTKKITILRDGPYEVSGNVPLTRADMICDKDGNSVNWKTHKHYDHDEPYHLCRCGQSKNKPFCDGTHNDVEFCGRERPDNGTYAERAKLMEGEGVDLLDDQSLCVGARFCDRGESAWGYVERSGSAENRKHAVEEACNCPSGRLTALEKDGTPIEPDLEQEISVVDDTSIDCRGPLWVKGGIPVEGQDGTRYEVRNRVALCRCGMSRNQPYCDGSHYDCPEMRGHDK